MLGYGIWDMGLTINNDVHDKHHTDPNHVIYMERVGAIVHDGVLSFVIFSYDPHTTFARIRIRRETESQRVSAIRIQH